MWTDKLVSIKAKTAKGLSNYESRSRSRFVIEARLTV